MAEESDFETLLQRAREGQRGARNQLAAVLSALAHEQASRRLGARLRRRFDSMDVSQDVVLRVLKGLAEFRGRTLEELAGWVVLQVERRIRDQADFHGAKRRNLDRDRPLPADPSSSVETPRVREAGSVLDEAERRETLDRLQKVLASLEPDDRRLLDLREAGRSWDDVARTLGLPSAEAARSRHRRVLARLQEGESAPGAE